MPLGLEPTADALRDVAPERLLDALSALDARMPSIERKIFAVSPGMPRAVSCRPSR